MQPIIQLKKTTSTNSYLKDLARAKTLEEGTVVCADYQLQGRGQRGNTWESEAGRNLLFSTIVYPSFIKANEQFIISQIISLAIKDFLSKRFDDISIKWPNDIYWKDKKIAGILIENNLQSDYISQSIIGIGLNVNQTNFKSDAPNPTSMRLIGNGQEVDRSAILRLVMFYIDTYYEDAKNGKDSEIVEAYKAALYRKDGYHKYIDSSGYFYARIKDVEKSGVLVLETKDGEEKRFAFKEVQYVL